MNSDQCLVVGLHLVCAAIIVNDVQLHLSAQQSPGFVNVGSPEFIALLERHAVSGEVTGKRK